LWFAKGRGYPLQRTIDTVISHQLPKGWHEWNKNLEARTRWIVDFAQPEWVLFDPFTGSGTIPAACQSSGRRFLAFGVDRQAAESARRRPEMAEPPLFGDPQELTMESMNAD
jgi:hypothetical protein